MPSPQDMRATRRSLRDTHFLLVMLLSSASIDSRSSSTLNEGSDAQSVGDIQGEVSDDVGGSSVHESKPCPQEEGKKAEGELMTGEEEQPME